MLGCHRLVNFELYFLCTMSKKPINASNRRYSSKKQVCIFSVRKEPWTLYQTFLYTNCVVSNDSLLNIYRIYLISYLFAEFLIYNRVILIENVFSQNSSSSATGFLIIVLCVSTGAAYFILRTH